MHATPPWPTGAKKRTSPARVLIVEDDDALLRGIVRIVAASGLQALGASSAEEALDRCAQFVPDVAVVDLRLPGMSGIAVRDALSERVPQCRYLFLTGAGTMDDAIAALRHTNTVDFLLKPVHPDVLMRAIEVALEAHAKRAQCPLSERELEVLGLLAAQRDTHDLAAELCVSVMTVKNHIRNIFSKLDVRERSHAVAVALRSGWLS
jgi:DNA-binding NarL/FixJ family response regulator